jgi:hypothetical protein
MTPLTRRQALGRASAIGAGTFVAEAGTAGARVAPDAVLAPTGVKTADYTAAPGDFVPVDASAGSVTITLPSAPADQSQVGVLAIAIASAATVYVICGGSDSLNRAGGAKSLALSSVDQGVALQYQASSNIWYEQATDLSLNVPHGAAQLGTDGTVGGPSGSPLTSAVVVTSTSNTFTAPQHITTSSSSILFDVGTGQGYGAPAHPPVATVGGAGQLSGDYQYAYTETDPLGQTPPSPASGTVSPSGNSVNINLPLPRRGTAARWLYRTKAGAPGTYYLLSTLTSGGNGYFQTGFTDNVPDSSLGAPPPDHDTTRQQRFVITNPLNGVMFLRSMPQSPPAADLTMLTSEPSNSGSYAIDAYGTVKVREHLGPAVATNLTGSGNGAHHLHCDLISISNPDLSKAPAIKTVYAILDTGGHLHTPAADVIMIDLRPVAGAKQQVLRVLESGDTQNRFQIDANGSIGWGSGSAGTDIGLSRAGAQLLQVSSNLSVRNAIGVGGGLAAGASPGGTVDVQTAGSKDATIILRTSVGWGNLTIRAPASSPGTVSLLTGNKSSALTLGTDLVRALTITTAQDVIVGPGAQSTPAELATSAATGLFRVPTMNGAPTGAPNAITGTAPMVVDRASGKLWVYIAGNWKGVTLS